MAAHSFIPQLRNLSPHLFVLSSPDLHLLYVFKETSFYTSSPRVCQSQIMFSTLSVGLGLPLPFKQGLRCKLSRYWGTDIRTLFSFIFRFHLPSDFFQLIFLLRLLLHTARLNSTLGLECQLSFLFCSRLSRSNFVMFYDSSDLFFCLIVHCSVLYSFK